ncbi:universal stress protein [Alkalinema sp. FACHB-956]|uniref:universal stress protein n=1 Tax=Alkalinema sp. FACHB-956 TaxID=2692768 RepID=UPI00168A246B|nr:universal stress protein [Alkalinema sp. FACHB-956]MBD2327440.1 universal stress protein [Alkalinema sp. FACHB-956]
MFRRILVALDRSDSSSAIFHEALTLARSMGAALMLLHVASVFEEGYSAPFYPGVDGIYSTLHDEVIKSYLAHWEEMQAESLNWLRSLCDQATEAGVPTEFSQAVGDPGQVICQQARFWNADLILVGRRGRKGFTELLLGSVSNYVLHHAPCSILTVQGSTICAHEQPIIQESPVV